MRLERTRRILVGILTLTMVVAAALPVLAASRGGTLRVGLKWDIRPLDPHVQKGYLVIHGCNQMYDYLIRERPDGSYEPRLATSWEMKEGGTVWIFNLRKGVKFHDGTDFDAEALKWNFERILKPETRSYLRAQYSIIKSLEVLDTHRLKIVLKRPSYFLAQVLGGIFTLRVISPTAVQKYGKDFVNHRAGTGPFMFESLTQDGTLTLVRNPNYWEKGLPYLDKVIIRSFRDVTAKANALRAGEIDVDPGTTMDLVKVIEADPKLYYVTGPTSYAINLGVNITMKPWDDIRVRKAVLGYAVDRKTIAKIAFFGLAEPKVTVGALTHPYTERLLDMYPYDLQKARSLLEEAGAVGKEITFTINNTDNAYKSIAAMLKASWEKIGLKVKIQVLDYQTWIKTYYIAHRVPFSTPLTYDSDPSYWPQYIGPRSRMNMTRMGAIVKKDGKEVSTDPVLNRLLDEASSAVLPEERKAAFQKLFRHIAEQAAMVGLCTKPFVISMRKDVKGYTWRNLNIIFDTVYFAK